MGPIALAEIQIIKKQKCKSDLVAGGPLSLAYHGQPDTDRQLAFLSASGTSTPTAPKAIVFGNTDGFLLHLPLPILAWTLLAARHWRGKGGGT